jgi:hypothetical protein
MAFLGVFAVTSSDGGSGGFVVRSQLRKVRFLSKSTSCSIVILVVILCGAASWHWQEMRYPFDFHQRLQDLEVYYTAACMIHENHGEEIYDGADNGYDPQLREADKDSIFAKAAQAHGIDKIRLYVYPPPLAYLMVPLSWFSIAHVESLWKIFNWAAIVMIASMLSALLGIRRMGLGSFAIVFCLFVYRPFLDCFYWGQITIILLALEMGGLLLLIRGYKVWGALLFAFATAIKLTPVIVIVPLIAKRDWKTLRAFGFWGAAIFGALWLPDRGKLLWHYFEFVLPSMSAGILSSNNKTLSNFLQFMWLAVSHGSESRWPALMAKLISILAVIYSFWLCRSKSGIDDNGLPIVDDQSNRYQAIVFSLFWLLSCCIAPVSWRHAYVLSAPALILLFKEALEGKVRLAEMVLLSCFTLSIASFAFESLTQKTGNIFLVAWAACTPVLGVAIVILELRKLRDTCQFAD